MIGPGWLPTRPRPIGKRLRTLAYTYRRSRRPAKHTTRQPVAVNNGSEDQDDMLFDQPPSELPIATVRTRPGVPQLLADVRRWLAARWSWLRPRTVPVIVAFIGMCAVLASAHYLSKLAQEAPEPLPRPTNLAEERLATIKIDVSPPGAVVIIDGVQQLDLPSLPMLPSHAPIRIVPQLQPLQPR
jgi:hypothetical protein